MESDDTKKIISERLDKIPKDVKDAILSVDYSDNLQEVVKRNRLMIDQAGKLEMETTLVLLGLEQLSDYTANLSKELGLPMSKAISVANDVNELIFRNIRDALQKMNYEDMLEEEKESDVSLNATPGSGFGVNQAVAPDRNSILSEIENPIKIRPATSVPQPKEAEVDITIPQSTVPAVTNILETKLQGEMSLPRQEIKIEEKNKIPPKNDPYREAII